MGRSFGYTGDLYTGNGEIQHKITRLDLRKKKGENTLNSGTEKNIEETGIAPCLKALIRQIPGTN